MSASSGRDDDDGDAPARDDEATALRSEAMMALSTEQVTRSGG